MWEVAKVLDEMVSAGVISNYAIFGAIAQMRYTEPVATLDVDVLVVVPDPHRIDLLTGIYSYLTSRGYDHEGEAIRIGKLPVQLVPVYDGISKEALEHAEIEDVEGSPVRVVSADYLAVLALSTGRKKDWARILALLESGSAHAERIADLSRKHGLEPEWERFKTRFSDEG